MPDYSPPSSGGGTAAIPESQVTSLQSDLALKAPLDTPTFTGTPAAPTAAQGTNTTQIATTAMVHSEAALLAPLASPALTGTPSLPTGTTGVTQSAGDGSTKLATTLYTDTAAALKLAKASNLSDLASASTARTNLGLGSNATVNTAIGPDRVIANASIYFQGTSGQAAGITLLKPIFYPVDLFNLQTFVVSSLSIKIATSVASNTYGLAIYSVTYPSSAHVSATLVAQLNATISSASVGTFNSDVTTGAAGSGAATYTLDLTANRYLVGFMGSEITTGRLTGSNQTTASSTGMGVLSWTAAARSSTTDWPASFTETSVSAVSTTTPLANIEFVTATGKFFL